MSTSVSKKPISSTTLSQAFCFGCGPTDQKVRKCSRCHFTTYCSVSCQQKHWKYSHSIACQGWQTLFSQKEAGKNTDSAITLSNPKEFVDSSGRTHTLETPPKTAGEYWEKHNGFSEIDRRMTSERENYSSMCSGYFSANPKIVEKELTCIDLGCGTGGHSLQLLEDGICNRVTAVDISSVGIEKLKERANHLNPKWIQEGMLQIEQKDILDFTFPTEVDIIAANQVLYFLPVDTACTVLRRVHDALKKHGIFYATLLVKTDSPHINTFYEDMQCWHFANVLQIQTVFSDLGFINTLLFDGGEHGGVHIFRVVTTKA